MVCGNYDKCQCYTSCAKDLVCHKDENDNIIISSKTEPYSPSDKEQFEGETEAECLSRYRKMRIQNLLKKTI